MSTQEQQKTIQEHLIKHRPTRVVAFGSSNTERGAHSEGKYNWFDWLDLGLRMQIGPRQHTINVGISGETTSDLTARFESAVEIYQPHIVLLTVGGNDSNPAKDISPALFEKQLRALVQRIQSGSDTLCVLQTYYSAVEEDLDPAHFKQFHDYMQIIRDVAASEGSLLIDNLKRWELLRLHDRALHKSLMRDALHVKPLGNMLWGLDVARAFGVDVNEKMHEWCHDGLMLQSKIDGLS